MINAEDPTYKKLVEDVSLTGFRLYLFLTLNTITEFIFHKVFTLIWVNSELKLTDMSESDVFWIKQKQLKNNKP
jgi:hypothetical protein